MQVGEEGELNLRGKKNRSPIVIGEVVGIHIDDKLITDGIVDITKVRPIARLGYVDYSVVNEVFGIMRRASPEAAIATSKKANNFSPSSSKDDRSLAVTLRGPLRGHLRVTESESCVVTAP
jgi:hypothetical protein